MHSNATLSGENWTARVWVSNLEAISEPLDSNGVMVDKPCDEDGCGVGSCSMDQYGVYNHSNHCALTCYEREQNQDACELCNNQNWSAASNQCCGAPSDSFCNIGGDSCVLGVYFKDHCSDQIMDCDEEGIDCNGTECERCLDDIEISPRTTAHLRAPEWQVLEWNFKKRGSDNYSVNVTPRYNIKEEKVNVNTKVKKLIYEYINGITSLFYNTRSEDTIVPHWDNMFGHD